MYLKSRDRYRVRFSIRKVSKHALCRFYKQDFWGHYHKSFDLDSRLATRLYFKGRRIFRRFKRRDKRIELPDRFEILQLDNKPFVRRRRIVEKFRRALNKDKFRFYFLNISSMAIQNLLLQRRPPRRYYNSVFSKLENYFSARLDQFMVGYNFAPTLWAARRLIKTGLVLLNNRVIMDYDHPIKRYDMLTYRTGALPHLEKAHFLDFRARRLAIMRVFRLRQALFSRAFKSMKRLRGFRTRFDITRFRRFKMFRTLNWSEVEYFFSYPEGLNVHLKLLKRVFWGLSRAFGKLFGAISRRNLLSPTASFGPVEASFPKPNFRFSPGLLLQYLRSLSTRYQRYLCSRFAVADDRAASPAPETSLRRLRRRLIFGPLFNLRFHEELYGLVDGRRKKTFRCYSRLGGRELNLFRVAQRGLRELRLGMQRLYRKLRRFRTSFNRFTKTVFPDRFTLEGYEALRVSFYTYFARATELREAGKLTKANFFRLRRAREKFRALDILVALRRRIFSAYSLARRFKNQGDKQHRLAAARVLRRLAIPTGHLSSLTYRALWWSLTAPGNGIGSQKAATTALRKEHTVRIDDLSESFRRKYYLFLRFVREFDALGLVKRPLLARFISFSKYFNVVRIKKIDPATSLILLSAFKEMRRICVKLFSMWRYSKHLEASSSLFLAVRKRIALAPFDTGFIASRRPFFMFLLQDVVKTYYPSKVNFPLAFQDLATGDFSNQRNRPDARFLHANLGRLDTRF